MINRDQDEAIINLINTIMTGGNMEVETINEAVLIKLMELRGTPIKYAKTYRDIETDYARWILDNKLKTDEEILAENGWSTECKSPFEIRHEDGSFASGQAAKLVLWDLKSDY